jgi:glycerol-3-phosphate dehydrogenase
MFKKVVLGAAAATAAAAIGFVALASDLQGRSNPDDIAAAKRWNNKIISEGFSVPSRQSHLSVLSGTSSDSPLDLLIIGGGASGCGCALDAATRGLKVGLVERDDFSSGTSSRSTKLVHGGTYMRCFESFFSCSTHPPTISSR